MPEIVQRSKGPWCGLASLTIALFLLAAIHFLSTQQGQHRVEEFFAPLGYAAILLGVVGPLLFLGLVGAALVLALFATIRREPFWLGELGATIIGALFMQANDPHAERWEPFPTRLLLSGVVVFGASATFRWIWRRLRRPGADLSTGSD